MERGTSEQAFETLIVDWLHDKNGFEIGTNEDYTAVFAIDETRLLGFLRDTQADKLEKLHLEKEAKKREFFARLTDAIQKRGVVDVLRKGVPCYPVGTVMLYAVTPSEENATAAELFAKNKFSVTRQLHYSRGNKRLALDLCIFLNGLPILTAELKNNLSVQSTTDALNQYKNDRDPKEPLFSFKRCLAHFAVDDSTAAFCTKLAGKESDFLPFNQGWNDGAGNPPNPDGIKTDYLWKRIWTKETLSKIIEHYAQVTKTENGKEIQVFPRYHQLDCVEALLANVRENGVGGRYLIQHSAGSGKSHSITWLAYQLVEMDQDGKPLFDSVLVVTDRKNLDKQIKDNIKQFAQDTHIVGWARRSGELKKFLVQGKRLIISTVEKFPFIVRSIGQTGQGKRYAVIIDEAHSSQSGRMAAKMNLALSGQLDMRAVEDDEDCVNALIEQFAEGRRMLRNASYFAFTATPKNRTLEVFGTAEEKDGEIWHRPFHKYSMKQAIEEEFVLDVLKNYTPVASYYRIIRIARDNPQYDRKTAQKKLRRMVEGKPETIEQKAGIIVNHFLHHVRAQLGGQARAMVVTADIARCIEYYYAIERLLRERESGCKAIIAFSGEKEYDGKTLDEAAINGFPSRDIETKINEGPYRLLIVADKFQTGYDNELLCAMYVDKTLEGIKAVQTLTRLNRRAPGKTEPFILDFANDAATIEKAFSSYYRSTMLHGETEPNQLYDLMARMEACDVYHADEAERAAVAYMRILADKENRTALDPILDGCAARYRGLDEETRSKFKSAAKSFLRLYEFLGAILPYGNEEWEKLHLFLGLLIRKLPFAEREDLAAGLLSHVDMVFYRPEVQKPTSIVMDSEANGVLPPLSATSGGVPPAPDMAELDKIVDEFNRRFGTMTAAQASSMKQDMEDLKRKVAENETYKNSRHHSDVETAMQDCRDAMDAVITQMQMNDEGAELCRACNDDETMYQRIFNYIFDETFLQNTGMRV